MPSNKVSLYVNNVPFDTNTDDLAHIFRKYGQLTDVYIPKHFYTQRPRGFAYIEFLNYDEALDAAEGLNGITVNGRQLQVEVAKGHRKSSHEMRVTKARLEGDREDEGRGGRRGRGVPEYGYIAADPSSGFSPDIHGSVSSRHYRRYYDHEGRGSSSLDSPEPYGGSFRRRGYRSRGGGVAGFRRSPSLTFSPPPSKRHGGRRGMDDHSRQLSLSLSPDPRAILKQRRGVDDECEKGGRHPTKEADLKRKRRRRDSASPSAAKREGRRPKERKRRSSTSPATTKNALSSHEHHRSNNSSSSQEREDETKQGKERSSSPSVRVGSPLLEEDEGEQRRETSEPNSSPSAASVGPSDSKRWRKDSGHSSNRSKSSSSRGKRRVNYDEEGDEEKEKDSTGNRTRREVIHFNDDDDDDGDHHSNNKKGKRSRREEHQKSSSSSAATGRDQKRRSAAVGRDLETTKRRNLEERLQEFLKKRRFTKESD